jgi:hypothetical protein
MADLSIDERFGIEPMRCDECGQPVPNHTSTCRAPLPYRCAALEKTLDEAEAAYDAELKERQAMESALLQAREAADQWAEAARTAQREACQRGFAIVQAAFEAWRDNDRGLGGMVDDQDVGLAVQSAQHALDRLARAISKESGQ